MDHTDECLSAHARWQQDDQQWLARWPHHCRRCGGWGEGSELYDPSPSGVALPPGYIHLSDPCPECVERGLCPRCGASGLPEDGPCAACGWNHDDGRPPQPECWCHCEEGHSCATS
jgi:hypothetical protein